MMEWKIKKQNKTKQTEVVQPPVTPQVNVSCVTFDKYISIDYTTTTLAQSIV